MIEDKNKHIPVMTKEVIAGLNIKSNGIYIDATFGCGGHTRAILENLDPIARLIVIDKDPKAITIAQRMKIRDKRIHILSGSYTQLLNFCRKQTITGNVNGILLDLGVSSPQLDQASRGFSFKNDGPLDMRMNPDHGISAMKWLSEASIDKISDVLKTYGEEKYSKKIARAIVNANRNKSITTTKILANVIAQAHPNWRACNKHPATKSFQAIRIFINQELEDLKKILNSTICVLAPGGRLVIISFHSLEDRMVKQFISTQVKGDKFPPKLPILASELNSTMRKVGKVQKPSDTEIRSNIRARSAILRVAERLPEK